MGFGFGIWVQGVERVIRVERVITIQGVMGVWGMMVERIIRVAKPGPLGPGFSKESYGLP